MAELVPVTAALYVERHNRGAKPNDAQAARLHDAADSQA